MDNFQKISEDEYLEKIDSTEQIPTKAIKLKSKDINSQINELLDHLEKIFESED